MQEALSSVTNKEHPWMNVLKTDQKSLKETNYIMKVAEFEWIKILLIKATIILLLLKCFMANL